MGEVEADNSKAGESQPEPQPKDNLIPDVKHLIAVSSGKGGVGKSTVAANLAVALRLTGLEVGLMDADIYGPNIPIMMGVTEPPGKIGEKIHPAEGHGVKVISMGFFVPEETPVVWRGPMVHGAIQQFFRDVEWGKLDYLLIDLPPGTGDVQLTLSQLVPLTGAITVTTPQEVALQDVRKGIMMFKKVNVPILGVIENMSYYLCSHCGERSEIFFIRWRRTSRRKIRGAIFRKNPHRSSYSSGGRYGYAYRYCGSIIPSGQSLS